MKTYYVARDGQQRGPLTEEEFKSQINQGEIQPEDLVWTERMSGWTEARTLFPDAMPPPIPNTTPPPIPTQLPARSSPVTTFGNTSGQGERSIVPPEIANKWNWGAFGLGWIWGVANNTWLALLTLIPFAGLVMAVVLGMKGNEWAWKNKRWESLEHFQQVQDKWKISGILFFLLSTIMAIAIVGSLSDMVIAIVGSLSER